VMAVSPPPLIGGRYQIVRSLGSPGFQGDVYEALDTYEGDAVAIKLLKRLVPGAVWLEAQILRRLADSHILPIRNADHDAGQPYLVTEIATHGSLDTLLASRGACGVDTGTVVRLVRQACMGVARAHDLRLLHNDIKPGNLFLNAEGECLVGDFGFASVLPVGGTTTVAPGFTIGTLSPEVAANPTGPTASFQSDIYALGATAYWLLAAGPPLDLSAAPTMADKLALVATAAPERLRDLAPHVPRKVQSAIETSMARNPADRFDKVVDFAAALGSRPAPARRWDRTDEHPGHDACWRGHPVGAGSVVLLCLETGPRASQVDVRARHAGSGNRIRRADRSGSRRGWAQLVRSAMNAVG
jgi:serine/threonine protein kinase